MQGDLKRNQTGMDQEPPTKRQFTGSGTRNELRFLIPSKMAGVVIGKGGANIRRLREEFSAKVSVPDSTGPERVLSLDGEPQQLEALLSDLLRSMQAEGGRDTQGAVSASGDIDLRMLVHQSQAGCIIGKGGSKIKELRESSRLRSLKVYSVLCPASSDRVVQMIGGPDDLLTSVRSISQLLESAPPKGQISGYNPANFDEFNFDQYGGWMGPGVGGRPNFGPRPDATVVGGLPPAAGAPGGFAMQNSQPLRSAAGLRGGPLAPPHGGPGAPNAAAAAAAAAGLGHFAPSVGRQSQQQQPNPLETTQQVSIPDSLTGSIMGRGGQRIKQIRAETGADIKIDRGDPGQDRIITIRGSHDQIQNAQYLMQMCVKKYSGQY